MSTPLESLRAAVKAAFGMAGVDLEAPRTTIMRVIRAVGARVSLQKIDAADQVDNSNPIEVWPSTPGVSVDPNGGEDVILSFVGQSQTPFVTGWSPVSMPAKVRHDARQEIRFVSLAGSATAKVYIGATPTLPVAMAGPVNATKAALLGFTGAVALNPTTGGIVAAAAALQTALNAIPSAASTNLEAK